MGSPHTIAIDVGNSRIKIGLLEMSSPGTLPHCLRSLSFAHGQPIPWEELVGWKSTVEATPQVVVAGVRPAAIEWLESEWRSDLCPAPRVLRSASELPLAVEVDFPDKVGIDRLLNAVAANALRPSEVPAIVVDSGTATTVDLVTPSGAFAGGAILPGLELGGRSLHQYTALLPLIAAHELSGEVPALGKNTTDAIRSGLLFGQVGAVRELVERLSLSASGKPLVLVTGGNGPLLANYLPEGTRLEADLPLKGLVLAVR